jgi:nitroreductase
MTSIRDRGKMETLDAIRTKRSVRQFSDQPVSDDIIRTILNAGRMSQSSKNSQPWEFVVIRDRATLQRLSTCGTYAGHLAGANFAVALVSTVQWSFDIGQAAAYLQLAGWDQGVSSCIAYIYNQEQAKSILSIPADRAFEIAISFGYAAVLPAPPKKGKRKSIEELVRWEHW